MAVEFTIEDVQAWLGCSRKAGKRVWLDSNFYEAMAKKAVGKFHLYFRKTSKESLFSQLAGSGFDKMAESRYLVWELQDKMKRKHQHGIKQYNFPDRQRFISYVKISVAGALADAAIRHLKNAERVSEDWEKVQTWLHEEEEKSVSGEDDFALSSFAPDEHGRLIQADTPDCDDKPDEDDDYTIAGKCHERKDTPEEEIFDEYDPERAVAQRHCLECAESLLDAFQNSPEFSKRKQLKNFFNLFVECAEEIEGGRLALLAMIEQNCEHLSFLEKMRVRQGDTFKKNLYGSYVRRIRKEEWPKFLETGEGSKLYQELKESYKACY